MAYNLILMQQDAAASLSIQTSRISKNQESAPVMLGRFTAHNISLCLTGGAYWRWWWCIEGACDSTPLHATGGASRLAYTCLCSTCNHIHYLTAPNVIYTKIMLYYVSLMYNSWMWASYTTRERYILSHNVLVCLAECWKSGPSKWLLRR